MINIVQELNNTGERIFFSLEKKIRKYPCHHKPEIIIWDQIWVIISNFRGQTTIRTYEKLYK